MDQKILDVAVIGAGLSGLMAARRLTQEGLRVAIFERSLIVGGRLATHSVGAGQADSGAQFFTVRSPEFGRHVEQWLDKGLVFEWSQGWSDGSISDTISDGHPRYVAQGGFGRLAEYLARGLTIVPSFPVTALSAHHDGWEIGEAPSPAMNRARVALLCLPVPQALALLSQSGISLPEEDRHVLNSIRYGSCLCGLLAVSGEGDLPKPGAWQRPAAEISWVADNHRKGISPHSRILTVHAGPAASQAYWHMDDDQILAWMWEEVRHWFAADARVTETRLVRWTYAVPLNPYKERYLLSGTEPPLFFAGDAFAGPRVEGAALSGLAAAGAILASLT